MKEYYLENFRLVYDSGAWFGETFKEKLKDITEAQAFSSPHPGVHSIAELVFHCIYWRNTLIRRLEGNKEKAPDDDPDGWRTVEKLKKAGWERLKGEFDDSQKKLVGLLHRASESLLNEEFSPGKSMSYVIEGVIQHDVYHLGQIGLVKKMTGG